MRIHPKFLLLIGTVFLASCGGLNVEKVPLEQVQDVPEDAQPAPFGLNEIRWAIPTGTPTVSQSPRGFFGLMTCDAPYGLVEESGVSARTVPSDEYRRIFRDTMMAEGYDVTGDPGRMFDEQEDIMRSVYAVSGRVTDVKIDLCRKSRWGIHRGDTGEAGITIEWTVYDLLHRKNVYKTVTKGYATRKLANYQGSDLLLEQAMAGAIHNLGAAPEFHDLIVLGAMPDDVPKTIQDINEEPAGQYDPQEEVMIKDFPLSTENVKGRLEKDRKAVVMIQAADTHGSGFFITKEGHILTNAHVVGDAVRVRVVTEGRDDKLIGEVLRLDRKRDVALVKLEDIPADLSIKVLPLRVEKPKVGDDVYAIGAPLSKRLQDTTTKGIVSALRYDRRTKQSYIQADVFIYGGNSGGPLLDENGNVIGITVSSWGSATEDLTGLNNFIPIGDALDKLDIGH